jgi:uncharacterized protein (TIGR02596 family)
MPAPGSPRRARTTGAFTLVELLVVLTIMAIIVGISAPAISSVLRSYNLNGASQALIGQLNFARQTAVARNQAVEVRFYKLTDPTSTSNQVYRGVQAFQLGVPTSGTTPVYTPITKPYLFPAGIIISSDATTASTIFNAATFGITGPSTDATQPPPYNAATYYSFRFRGTGQTDLTPATTSPVLTVYPENSKIVANGLPADFLTLQIDVINGTVRYYQP